MVLFTASLNINRLSGWLFKNMGQSRPLFVYFRSFLIPITISIIQIEKSIDGVHGIQTRGRRIVGKEETTELWRHPKIPFFVESSLVSLTNALPW